jgi:DNA-binding FrmR family transcriptional regulator
MFRQSVRRFGTTALRAVEASTVYHERVSRTQGVVNGLTEGIEYRNGHLTVVEQLHHANQPLSLQLLETPLSSD